MKIGGSLIAFYFAVIVSNTKIFPSALNVPTIVMSKYTVVLHVFFFFLFFLCVSCVYSCISCVYSVLD